MKPKPSVEKAKPYVIVSHKAWENQNNAQLLKLDWNEATVPPSPKVYQGLYDFLSTGNLNWYPDTNNQRLLFLLSTYLQVPLENVQYFASSDSLHELILNCFIKYGDSIVLVSPTYDNFRATAELNGALIKHFFLDDNYQLDFLSLEKELNDSWPKLVYLCNPNNPTGSLFDNESILELVNKFNDVLFIVDEAYTEFSETSLAKESLSFPNLILTRTFSKAFALASFRIGYVVSNSQIIEILNKVRNPKNITALSQVAACAALEDIDYMRKYVVEVNIAKSMFVDSIAQFEWVDKVFESHANFILLKMPIAVGAQLLPYMEARGVFFRNLNHLPTMFGCVRITIGSQSQMMKVIQYLQSFQHDVLLIKGHNKSR